MRIVAIQDYLRVGGTEAQFLDLTARWASGGHEVRRLVFRRGGGLAEAARSGGPRPVFLQPFASPWNWWAPGLAGAVRDARPDRIICFGRNAHRAFAGSFPRESHPGVVATLRTGRALPAGYRRLLRGAGAVVANSAFAAERARALGVAGGRIHTIANGCLLADRPVPSRAEARAGFGVGESELVLVCLGSFVPGKAQERLIDEWNALAPESRGRARLWFVGDGPRRRAAQRRARRSADAGRIRFWGARADPGRFLAAADLSVSVSREESSPNALVESLWLGVPVLALACAGVAELVREGADGFVVADSDEDRGAFGRKLGALLAEPDTLASLRGTAGRGGRERFDPGARARDYLRVFAEMTPFPAEEKGGARR
ncbi:MAG: glycosyltransferase family 4 protein [Puniceicoccaceae bacterium]